MIVLRADDEVGVKRLARVIAALLTAGLLTLFVRGADRPADPYLKPLPGGAPATAPPTSGAP